MESKADAPKEPTTGVAPSADDREAWEIKKLRLEVTLLEHQKKEKHGWYKTPTFWLSVSAVLISLIGVIAQSYLSSIKSERTAFAVDKATAELERVKSEAKGVEEKRVVAVTALTAAKGDAKAYGEKVELARHTLEAVADKIADVQKLGQGTSPEVREALVSLLEVVGLGRNALEPVQFHVAGPTTAPTDFSVPGAHWFAVDVMTYPKGMQVAAFPEIPGRSMPFVSSHFFLSRHPELPLAPCRLILREGKAFFYVMVDDVPRYYAELEVPSGKRLRLEEVKGSGPYWRQPTTQPTTESQP